jgi:cytidylate kinase
MSRPKPEKVVAIDGPGGSGKSTIARGLGRALGWPVLDTGAMYRAVTLAVLEQHLPPDDEQACARIAEERTIAVDDGTTMIDGRDVSDEIRGPSVTAAVSVVSAHPSVRTVLVSRQRAWLAEHGAGVVEGRDIGTVVFPAAPVKVFLTASDEERARRRQRDEAAFERSVRVDEVQTELARRDALDSGRTVSPLRPADDAIVIDTTDRTVDEVVAELVERAHAAGIA